MKQLKMLVLMLTALFALAAAAAATASAAPEIKLLEKEVFPVAFTSVAGASTLETAGVSIKCTAATNAGEFTSATEGKVTVIFTGCKDSKGSKCKTPTSPNAEEIELAKAGTQLVAYTNGKSELAAGVVITLAEKLKITCGVLKDTVEGAAMGDLSPINTKKDITEAKLVYTQTGAGKQTLTTCTEPAAFCAKGPFTLTSELGKGLETGSEVSSDTITSKRMFEIVA